MRLQKITFLEIISSLLIMLWLYAAVIKLLEYDKFIMQLGQSSLLGPVAGFTAIAVPLIEIVIAVLLVRNKTLTTGLYASAALLIVFTLYLTGMLLFSPKVPCACGGIIGSALSWRSHIVFNLFFVGLSGVGIWLKKRPDPHQSQTTKLAV